MQFQGKDTYMTTLDAQSKDARYARSAIMGLLSRGSCIKAFYNHNGRSWSDFHIVVKGQRHEANQTVLKGIAESGKATIVDDQAKGFVCFTAPNLSFNGKFYVQV